MGNNDYSVKEVAKMLGCSPSNVYRIIENGQLKARRKPVAVELRVTLAEINRYKKQRTTK